MVLRPVTPDELEYIKKCRNVAKDLGFGILYGAGAKTAGATIKKADYTLSTDEAQALGKRALEVKKGKRNAKYKWEGGSDSASFNAMEQIANQSTPVLPVLGTKISTALRPSVVGKDFAPMRQNWVIQATGSEFRDLVLVATSWLAQHYKIDYNLVMTIHDEFVWLVKESEAYLFSYLFFYAYRLTWEMVHKKMGINELPYVRAYFSSVAIDHISRKEGSQATITPSNPEPIPPGIDLTIKNLIQMGIPDQLQQRALSLSV